MCNPKISTATSYILTIIQDIAPTYYDIQSFPKGEVRSALVRAAERLSRKEKMRVDKRR